MKNLFSIAAIATIMLAELVRRLQSSRLLN
jgi:hypothetical protein